MEIIEVQEKTMVFRVNRNKKRKNFQENFLKTEKTIDIYLKYDKVL
jgi:hypothetical protein